MSGISLYWITDYFSINELYSYVPFKLPLLSRHHPHSPINKIDIT
jgi:hypothetical protein